MIHAILALLVIHIGVNLVGWSLSGAQPAVTTSLSAGITASDTTIPVASITGFPNAGGWLYIGGEAIHYDDEQSPCTTGSFNGEPGCFTGATRGQLETIATSHANGSRVYDEASGVLNGLSTFESRTSVDNLGDVTTPWGSGRAIMNFLSHASTWDWPMFDGDFAFLRLLGGMITAAIGLGIFLALGYLMVSAIRTVRG